VIDPAQVGSVNSRSYRVCFTTSLIDPQSALCYDFLGMWPCCVEGALALRLSSTALRKYIGTR
jgi:hypothetical protein